MNSNKFLIGLVLLCATLQYNAKTTQSRIKKQPDVSIAEEFPTQENFNESNSDKEPSKGYWESYAPLFMQNAATSTKNYAASWIPESIKNRVNNWSIPTKLTVIAAVLASLLTVYNKEEIINYVSELIKERKREIEKERIKNKITGTPMTYEELVAELLGKTNIKPPQ